MKTMSQTSPITSLQTSTWNIDPVHSTAEFKVKHMMIVGDQVTITLEAEFVKA
jgi:polyisoprenoid-binding protein YceI